MAEVCRLGSLKNSCQKISKVCLMGWEYGWLDGTRVHWTSEWLYICYGKE